MTDDHMLEEKMRHLESELMKIKHQPSVYKAPASTTPDWLARVSRLETDINAQKKQPAPPPVINKSADSTLANKVVVLEREVERLQVKKVLTKTLADTYYTPSVVVNAAYGDGVTDATAAIQAAITEVAALPLHERPAIYIPAGKYLVSSGFTGIPKSCRIMGAGRQQTHIIVISDEPLTLFNLGTFDSTPATVYEGVITGFMLEDMLIEMPAASYVLEGSRLHTCIQDNGNGHTTLNRVWFGGFKYGFAAPYGSDFTSFTECRFIGCDVGVYFGPGSQQVMLLSVYFNSNRESLVIENSAHGNVYGCSFYDATVADMSVEVNATTRFGLTSWPGATAASTNWTVRDCWFESRAVPELNRIPPQHILTGGDQAGYPQYFRVINPYLVSGGSHSETNCFWRVTNGTRMSLEGLTVYGEQISYAVDVGGLSPNFYQRDTRQVDGYTSLLLWNQTTPHLGLIYEERIRLNGRQVSTVGSFADAVKVLGDTVNRWTINGTGDQEWGPGNAAVDTNLYRAAANVLKTAGQMRAASLGVGNSAAATTLGNVVKKMQIYDASGNSLGYIPIYDAIT